MGQIHDALGKDSSSQPPTNIADQHRCASRAVPRETLPASPGPGPGEAGPERGRHSVE